MRSSSVTRIHLTVLALLAWATPGLSPAAAETAQLRAELAAHPEIAAPEILVTGIEAGGEVAILGGGHELVDTVTYSVQCAERLADEDLDGEIRFAPDRSPAYSAWLVVDLATGAVAAASPLPGSALEAPRRDDFPGHFWPEGSTSRDVLRLDSGRGRLLVVRPGVAAWSMRLAAAAETQTALAHEMESLGAEPATFDSFEAGDVLAFFDPRRTSVAARRLSAEDLEGGDVETGSEQADGHQGGE